MPAKIIYYLYNVVFFTKEHIPAVYKKTKQEWVDYKELPRGAAAGVSFFITVSEPVEDSVFVEGNAIYFPPPCAERIIM